MKNKDLDKELQNLKYLRDLIYAYQEIAAFRMRRVREEVLKSRDFYKELLDIYKKTNYIYFRTYKKTFQPNSNNKKAAIFLSANTGLYGNVIYETFKNFLQNHKNDDYELIVVGKLAKKWMEEIGISKGFTHFDMPDTTSNITAYAKALFEKIKDFEQIIIYHGIFENITTQKATQTIITNKALDLEPAENYDSQTLSFIFEPSIEKVLDIFIKQILYSFLEQAINEGNLAKYGSRMLSLAQSQKNIEETIEKNKLLGLKYKHENQNKKLNEQTMSLIQRMLTQKT